MFSYIKKNRKKPEAVIEVEETVKCNVASDEQANVIAPSIVEEAGQDSDMVKDLALLVSNAIEIWTKKYGLKNLPRYIVLEQVISILSTVKEIMK